MKYRSGRRFRPRRFLSTPSCAGSWHQRPVPVFAITLSRKQMSLSADAPIVSTTKSVDAIKSWQWSLTGSSSMGAVPHSRTTGFGKTISTRLGESSCASRMTRSGSIRHGALPSFRRCCGWTRCSGYWPGLTWPSKSRRWIPIHSRRCGPRPSPEVRPGMENTLV
jgi:hypothetical protein